MAPPAMGGSDQRHVVGRAGGVFHIFNFFVGTTDYFVLCHPSLPSVSISTPRIDADLDFPARVPHVSVHSQPANLHPWSCLSARGVVLFPDFVPAEISAGVSWFAALELCCPAGDEIAFENGILSRPRRNGIALARGVDIFVYLLRSVRFEPADHQHSSFFDTAGAHHFVTRAPAADAGRVA